MSSALRYLYASDINSRLVMAKRLTETGYQSWFLSHYCNQADFSRNILRYL